QSLRKSKKELSIFLLKRGLWLIVAEVVLVSLGISFDLSWTFIFLQVIWAIGCSMIILGLLIRTNYLAILIVGIVLFFGHNLTNYINFTPNSISAGVAGVIMTTRGAFLPIDSTHAIGAFYAILPWTGIMLLGYCTGRLFEITYPVIKRRKSLLGIGLAMVFLFILLRITNVYGNPEPWDGRTIFSFLDTSKYPPSLQYSCMTLGPALILMSFLETSRMGWTKVVSIYGKVPFFYYILHFYLLHLVLIVLFFITGHTTAQITEANNIFWFRPINFGYGLAIVYTIWIGVVAILYLPSRWYTRYKSTNQHWWLKYI
ncbi:MAG: DUF1624 domain-containing protein, partial [Chitinophagaceae bacterium]